MNILKLLVLSSVLAANLWSQEGPSAQLDKLRASFKVVLKVVDDTGTPVPGADVGFGWGPLDGPKPDAGDRRTIANENGEAVFEGRTYAPEYAYGARKTGYYPYHQPSGTYKDRQSGRWEPWGQTIQVVLRKIRNPVQMYAKECRSILPVVGTPVGYDLAIGDWVAPFGRGTHVDFEFSMDSQVVNRSNYRGTLSLRLPQEGNGLQFYDYMTSPNALKLFYEAPATGYEPTSTWEQSSTLQYSTDMSVTYPTRRIIFRVRSTLDSQGKFFSAWYGKIYGPVRLTLTTENQWEIKFLYYLNPDTTRNLEFDPKRNLFKDQNVLAP